MQKKVIAAYFSPTGGTRRVALELAKGMGEVKEEVDLSLPGEERRFEKGDVVIVAAPVFGGRIPAYMAEKLRFLKGGGAAAVTAAVYGNRAYEDALVELGDLLKQQGFAVTASAAAIAEHSIIRSVAAGRPDEKDCVELNRFGAQIARKLSEAEEKGEGRAAEPETPGNRPYKEWSGMQGVPSVSDRCVGCGLCASKCPTGAIPSENPTETDPGKCMLCVRCVAVCPSQARALPEPMMAMLREKLSPFEGIRRENELFL